jgi:hypothetical protein
MRRAIAGGTMLIGIGLAAGLISGTAGADVLPPSMPTPPSLPALPVPSAPVPVPSAPVPPPVTSPPSAPVPVPPPPGRVVAPSGASDGAFSGSPRSVTPSAARVSGTQSTAAGGTAGGSHNTGSPPSGGSPGAGGAHQDGATAQRRSRKVRRMVARNRGCVSSLPRAQRRVLLLRAALTRENPRARLTVAGRLHITVRRVAQLERRGVRALERLAANGSCREPATGSTGSGSGAAGADAGSQSGTRFVAVETGRSTDVGAAGASPQGSEGLRDASDGASGEVRGESRTNRGKLDSGPYVPPLAGVPLEAPATDQSPFVLLLGAFALLFAGRFLWAHRPRRAEPY